MKRIFKTLLTVAMMFAATSAVSAESYLGLGVGLNFNLGSLANTILNDGLDSGRGHPDLTANTGTTGTCSVATAIASGGSTGFDSTCRTEVRGNKQQLIAPENELKALSKATGRLIEVDTNGSMTGLVLSAYYETNVLTDWAFFRVGLDYTFKVLGGETKSTIGGAIEWYKVIWDYKAINIPVYLGIKAAIGEKTAVYMGLGLNYFRGGWEVGGNNMGDLVAYGTGLTSYGAVTVEDPANGNRPVGGGFIGESIKLKGSGVGFNFLIGLEGKMASGNKFFMEYEIVTSGVVPVSQVKTAAAASHLAPFASKPVLVGGTNYKFGMKFPM